MDKKSKSLQTNKIEIKMGFLKNIYNNIFFESISNKEVMVVDHLFTWNYTHKYIYIYINNLFNSLEELVNKLQNILEE